MKKVFAMLATATLLAASGAQAYNIKHSYSAPGDATEYYGQCANGAMLMIVESADGRFRYEGPAGEGVDPKGSLDSAAKAACGE